MIPEYSARAMSRGTHMCKKILVANRGALASSQAKQTARMRVSARAMSRGHAYV